MTQLARSSAPQNQYSKGRYATTTTRFVDSGEFTATAWQGDATRSANRPCRSQASPRRLASPAASAGFVVFMLTADVSGSEPNPAATVPVKTLERPAPSVDAAASMSEEAVYGVYAPPRPRRVLHSEVVEFRTETLRRRLPRITSDDSFLAVIDDE